MREEKFMNEKKADNFSYFKDSDECGCRQVKWTFALDISVNCHPHTQQQHVSSAAERERAQLVLIIFLRAKFIHSLAFQFSLTQLALIQSQKEDIISRPRFSI